MSETNPQDWFFAQQTLDIINHIRYCCRITGTVGKYETIWIHIQDFLGWCLGRNYRCGTTGAAQFSQNVIFYPAIVDNNFIPFRHLPAGFVIFPIIRITACHLFYEV